MVGYFLEVDLLSSDNIKKNKTISVLSGKQNYS